MLSLVNGYIFMNNYETFYSFSKEEKEVILKPEELSYPHIAVNIGSGVSILLVKSNNDIQRVSGTNIGGGTLIGLSKLLVDVDNYDTIMEMASKGDNKQLDLIIKDIYGEGVKPHNLDEDILASSFGKLAGDSFDNIKDKVK